MTKKDIDEKKSYDEKWCFKTQQLSGKGIEEAFTYFVPENEWKKCKNKRNGMKK